MLCCMCNPVTVRVAVYERLLRTSDDFVWPIDSCLQGRFIIDVEFLDLKIYTPNVSFVMFCSVQVCVLYA